MIRRIAGKQCSPTPPCVAVQPDQGMHWVTSVSKYSKLRHMWAWGRGLVSIIRILRTPMADPEHAGQPPRSVKKCTALPALQQTVGNNIHAEIIYFAGLYGIYITETHLDSLVNCFVQAQQSTFTANSWPNSHRASCNLRFLLAFFAFNMYMLYNMIIGKTSLLYTMNLQRFFKFHFLI